MEQEQLPAPGFGSHLWWYNDRIKRSGITESVASACALTLGVDDRGGYLQIPYFTPDKVITTYHRKRYRVPEDGGNIAAPSGFAPRTPRGESSSDWQARDHSTGRGKYWNPPKQKNRVYYPPLGENQLRNLDAPLLVVEGELKAVSTLSHALGSDLGVAVVGLPGVGLTERVVEELRNIVCMATLIGDEIHRDVFLCLDWNEQGDAHEALRIAEARLTDLFERSGARVYVLRWPIEVEGPQKIDDWLVAGGDLSTALRLSRERRAQLDTELQQEWARLNSTYAIHYGKFIPLIDHGKKLTAAEFNIMEAFFTRPEGRRTSVTSLERWGRQPNDDRNIINGFVFVPAPLGTVPTKYVWQGEQRMLNIARHIEWPRRSPWDDPVSDADVEPFLYLLEHLCNGEGHDWLLRHFAHCAQRPDERGPHIVIFAGEGASGKNTLLEFAGDVFGAHACNKVDSAFNSPYNDELENLIVAYWSEPQKDEKGLARNLLARLKNYSGDAYLSINHKYGNKYTIKNYGRLFILMNDEWLVPVEEDERRFTVFGPRGKINREFVARFKEWAHGPDRGIDLVREYLLGVDLSSFDIHAPGPHTARRSDMVATSAHPIRQWLYDPNDCDTGLAARDVWPVAELRRMYGVWLERPVTMTPKDFSGQLKRNGCSIGHNIKINGIMTRVAIIRNVDAWLARAAADGQHVLAQEAVRGDKLAGG